MVNKAGEFATGLRPSAGQLMNMRMFEFDLEDCDSCGLILRFESGITYSCYSLQNDDWQEHTIASESGLLVPLFYLTGDRDSEVRFI